MRGVALLASVLVVAGLAGCTGGAKSPPAEPAVTSTTGLLRGVVFDDAVRPLGGVSITANGQGKLLNATTDNDGLFAFGGLEPGTYLVEASKQYYSMLQRAVVVEAGVEDPETARFQLVFEAGTVPFAQTYKLDGYFECGFSFQRLCSQPNIATWIVLCHNTGVCIGNVTTSRSLLVQAIDKPPTFLQSELVWKATTDAGTALQLLLGGANEAEFQAGMAPAFNVTEGPSPLLNRLSNHESPDSWCHHNGEPPFCTGTEVLNESKIGLDRSLLVQVEAAAGIGTPLCGTTDPCGAGFSFQQPFTLYTTAFYGYEPPDEWRFSDAGEHPPPP